MPHKQQSHIWRQNILQYQQISIKLHGTASKDTILFTKRESGEINGAMVLEYNFHGRQ
jgi:hypothetical protein